MYFISINAFCSPTLTPTPTCPLQGLIQCLFGITCPFIKNKYDFKNNKMEIIKRLPSGLAQHVYSFDDTYRNAYRVVIIQFMYYQFFTLHTISHLNRYKTTHLYKRRKITCNIKEFISFTNKEFDMNKINTFETIFFYVKCINRIIVVING